MPPKRNIKKAVKKVTIKDDYYSDSEDNSDKNVENDSTVNKKPKKESKIVEKPIKKTNVKNNVKNIKKPVENNVEIDIENNIKTDVKTKSKIIKKPIEKVDVKTPSKTNNNENINQEIIIDEDINEKVLKTKPKKELKPKKGYFLINKIIDKNVIILDYTFTPRKYKTERNSNIVTEYTFVKECTENDMIEVRNDCAIVFKNHRIKEVNSEFTLLKNAKTNENIVNELIEKIEAKNYMKNNKNL